LSLFIKEREIIKICFCQLKPTPTTTTQEREEEEEKDMVARRYFISLI